MTAAKPETAPLRDRLETVAAHWHKTARDMRQRQHQAELLDKVHAAYLRGQADTMQECAGVVEAHLDVPDGPP